MEDKEDKVYTVKNIETINHPPSWFLIRLTQCSQQARHCFDIFSLTVIDERLVAHATNKGVLWEKKRISTQTVNSLFQ